MKRSLDSRVDYSLLLPVFLLVQVHYLELLNILLNMGRRCYLL